MRFILPPKSCEVYVKSFGDLPLEGIHLRPELHAYCRYDELGDIDQVVSVTDHEKNKEIALVSIRRNALDSYLNASGSAIVRMFEFTLFKPENFSGWPDNSEQVVSECENLFYRQNIVAGHAGWGASGFFEFIPPKPP
jgi:hypothetical protein